MIKEELKLEDWFDTKSIDFWAWAFEGVALIGSRVAEKPWGVGGFIRIAIGDILSLCFILLKFREIGIFSPSSPLLIKHIQENKITNYTPFEVIQMSNIHYTILEVYCLVRGSQISR